MKAFALIKMWEWIQTKKCKLNVTQRLRSFCRHGRGNHHRSVLTTRLDCPLGTSACLFLWYPLDYLFCDLSFCTFCFCHLASPPVAWWPKVALHSQVSHLETPSTEAAASSGSAVSKLSFQRSHAFSSAFWKVNLQGCKTMLSSFHTSASMGHTEEGIWGWPPFHMRANLQGSLSVKIGAHLMQTTAYISVWHISCLPTKTSKLQEGIPGPGLQSTSVSPSTHQ